MKKVLVICGATASGKTSLAINCALKLKTEIISADSQLIYRGLNIGTAKPTVDEMCGVKHHMIDIINPAESFSVSDYASMALPVINKLCDEGKIPIICGGTGFYINSLLFKLGYGHVAADNSIRDKYSKILNEKGKEYLFNLLKEVDPETAEKLHVNDTKRVIRALEIFEVSGKRKSDQNDGLIPAFDYVAVAVNYPREELYSRIDKRVDEMFEHGLLEEVQALLDKGIDENYQCMQAIGYKEVLKCLNNGDLRSTMSDIIKLNTRHYAKRQITFFKRLPNIIWIDSNLSDEKKIAEILNEVY